MKYSRFPTNKSGLLILAGAFSVIVIFRHAWLPPGGVRNVFDSYSYYFAAEAVNRDLNPYDPEVLKSIGSENGFKVIYPYLYPPLLVTCYRPLTALEPYTAHRILIIINSIFLGITFLLLYKTVPLPEKHYYFLLIYILFQSLNGAVLMTFRLGQINPLVMVLVLFCLHFHFNRQDSLSALTLSLAVLLKITPFILLLYFLFFSHKRWNYLVKFALWTSLLIILSLFISGPKYWLWFANRVLEGTPYNTIGSIWGLLNILSQFSVFLTDFKIWIYTLIVVLLLGLAFISIRNVETSRRPLYAFSLLMLISLLISPLTWSHHYYYCILSFFYLPIHFWIEGKRTRSIIYAGLALVILLHTFPMLTRNLGYIFILLVSQIKTIASFLVLWLSFRLFKVKPESHLAPADIQASARTE